MAAQGAYGGRTMQLDPIHQFEIKNFFPVFNIGGYEISFTNSALYMFIVVGLVSALLIGFTARRAVVPGRLQSIAEMSYEFVANTVRSSAGNEGIKQISSFELAVGTQLCPVMPYSGRSAPHGANRSAGECNDHSRQDSHCCSDDHTCSFVGAI